MATNTTPTPYGHPDDGQPEIDEQQLLAALTDERCRAILGALDEEPLSASELMDELDIPCSTLYRKIETLVEASLLEERNRVCLGGNNESEYVRRVDTLSLDIVFGDDAEISVSADGDEPAVEEPRLPVA